MFAAGAVSVVCLMITGMVYYELCCVLAFALADETQNLLGGLAGVGHRNASGSNVILGSWGKRERAASTAS